MSRPGPLRLFLVLAGVLALFSLAVLAKGGLYLSTHEGDTLHLLDIVIRIAAGERIHQDFMTPIGVMAVWPIAAFVKAGIGMGHALIYAQTAAALVLLPAIWWAVWSRLTGLGAWLTGIYAVILTVALSYGDTAASLSMSMHYNRWAWAVAYVVILLALLPPLVRPRPVLDGALIGLGLALLVLTKVTYFVAFAPAVAVALLLRRDRAALAAAVAAGLAVAALATALGGIGFWQGYIADLRTVAASANRTSPGDVEFGTLLGAPEFLGINALLLAAVIQLRHTGAKDAGLLMLILAPGLVYVTWQNYGNDPQWLILFVALLLQLRPGEEMRNGFGWSMRQMMNMMAAAALAFAAPSFLNLAYSAYRHLGVDTAKYMPLVPQRPQHDDLQTTIMRAHRVDGQVAMDGPGTPFAAYREDAGRKAAAEVNGVPLPDCELLVGMTAWYGELAADLERAGYAGKRLYEADLFNILYLFGDFPRLPGAAPWYYGGTPGLDAADLVLVADCPIGPDARKQRLEAIERAGVGLREVHRSPLYRLYEPVPAAASPGG